MSCLDTTQWALHVEYIRWARPLIWQIYPGNPTMCYIQFLSFRKSTFTDALLPSGDQKQPATTPPGEWWVHQNAGSAATCGWLYTLRRPLTLVLQVIHGSWVKSSYFTVIIVTVVFSVDGQSSLIADTYHWFYKLQFIYNKIVTNDAQVFLEYIYNIYIYIYIYNNISMT